jgi:hypothetical protein
LVRDKNIFCPALFAGERPTKTIIITTKNAKVGNTGYLMIKANTLFCFWERPTCTVELIDKEPPFSKNPGLSKKNI